MFRGLWHSRLVLSSASTSLNRLIQPLISRSHAAFTERELLTPALGLLTVSKSSFLISITRRQQVAQVQGKPIYLCTEVAITPLLSRKEAEKSVLETRSALQQKDAEGEGLDYSSGSESEDEEGARSPVSADEIDDHDLPSTTNSSAKTSGAHKRTSSVAEDVITRKGGYGRFAQNWFSKKGWAVDQKRNLGITVSDSNTETLDAQVLKVKTPPIPDTTSESGHDQVENVNDVTANLLPKLLRTAHILFGTSQSFYFSYDYDITRSLASRRINNSDLPLFTQVDPLYFWNRNLLEPFISSGHHSLVLPLMQGFVGQRTFEMDTNPPEPKLGVEKSSVELTDFSIGGEVSSAPESEGTKNKRVSFLLTLISRRSVKRAGLRYLRRGVDDEGNTANGVETEQILSDVSWTSSKKIHSFVQIRGSMPIFFSQSPYSFKPVPQIQHSAETNHEALVKHFENIKAKYGDVQVVSLVEKHGNEAIVGDAYEHHVKRLNDSGGLKGDFVGFEWFDFHAICRGMKFENVSLLMETLGNKLDAFGDTVEVDGKQVSKQCGVLRTNCMDCLDRTNVVQSACGRRALELQLKDEGLDLGLQIDQATQWFNHLWADNGDAISKQYASTAALKGDFTRNKKRDYRGALTDMGLSISRFYSGIVNDYFSQAAIDFLTGTVTAVVFEDFEANLMSGDPAVSAKKLRQQAIETCQKLVVADQDEESVGGWTLLMPNTTNTIRSTPFEESVLLLTDAALYACKFDWNMEKVSSFERVDLQHIIGIKYGTYITSTLSRSQTDEKTNVGLIVTYKAGSDDIVRVNTRSLSTLQSQDDERPDGSTAPLPSQPTGFASFMSNTTAPTHPPRILAAKALSSRTAVADGTESRLSEVEFVKSLCLEIERMVLIGKVVEVGTERKELLESGSIISLADAKKSTGLLEQLGHSIKKLVWA